MVDAKKDTIEQIYHWAAELTHKGDRRPEHLKELARLQVCRWLGISPLKNERAAIWQLTGDKLEAITKRARSEYVRFLTQTPIPSDLR